MATSRIDESEQFKEPITPTASQSVTSSASKSTENESAKPSITGVLKSAVNVPPVHERVNEQPIENAIEQIGDDGQKKGT